MCKKTIKSAKTDLKKKVVKPLKSAKTELVKSLFLVISENVNESSSLQST